MKICYVGTYNIFDNAYHLRDRQQNLVVTSIGKMTHAPHPFLFPVTDFASDEKSESSLPENECDRMGKSCIKPADEKSALRLKPRLSHTITFLKAYALLSLAGFLTRFGDGRREIIEGVKMV